MRKAYLQRPLSRRPDGIFMSDFARPASEGLVSKRSDRPYRGGRCKDWIKVKNRKHPAMQRMMETFS
jgi:bifunctional non-homologous end joining protein LigD